MIPVGTLAFDPKLTPNDLYVAAHRLTGTPKAIFFGFASTFAAIRDLPETPARERNSA